jgi:hypothetical protein
VRRGSRYGAVLTQAKGVVEQCGWQNAVTSQGKTKMRPNLVSGNHVINTSYYAREIAPSLSWQKSNFSQCV